MSVPTRLLHTGFMSACRNIAVTAALANRHLAEQSPDTLRLCRYPHSVLVRRHWRLADAVRRCRIDVARRVTAVGNVNMSPGALARKVVPERYRFGGRLGEVSSRIAAVIARFLLPAQPRTLNDGEIDGRKISGSSALIDSSILVFQGMVLNDVGFAEMAATLRLLAARTGHEACISSAAHMTSPSEWLGRVPSKDERKGPRTVGVSRRRHQEFRPYALTSAGLRLKDCHLDEGLGTDEFADIPMIVTTVPEARADRVAAKGAHMP